MKKTLTVLMIALIAITTVFAGGAKEEKIQDRVVIWHSNSGILGDTFDALVKNWNDTHDIQIEAIYQGKANDVLTKLKAATMAGQSLPDIAQLDATAGLDMFYSEDLVPVEALGVDTSDILPVAYSAYDSSRGHLGVPFNSSSLLYYYNRTMFENAGVEVPTTLDELIAIAPEIKAANGVPALSNVPTTYELCTFLGAWEGGSYMADNRNGHDGVPTEVLFDDNGSFKAFLEKWSELYATGALENLTSGVSSAFASGKTASILASSSNLTTIKANVGDRFELGVARVPMVDENATGGSNIGGGCLASFNDNPAVKEVIEYFIGPESQLYWATETGYMPINMKAIESEEWKTLTEEDPLFSVAIEQAIASDEKVTGLWIPSGYQVYHSFQSTIKEVLENGLTPDQAVENMRSMIEGAIRDYEI